MGGDGARARRRSRPLGFPGVAGRVAFALAAVQFATCAALAVETARGFDGGEGPDGGTAPSPATDPLSAVTQGAPAPVAPAVEDASVAPDLGSSAPRSLNVDASLATVCAAKGFWYPFDDEVLRQTNASHSESRVCVTDAEEGASAAAAAAAEAHAAAKREALAKKKEKEKIPSLRDFKSDLEAKVADARDAKKGKKEAEQREKEPREPREVEAEARGERGIADGAREAGRADSEDPKGSTGPGPDPSLADSAEPVPTPPVPGAADVHAAVEGETRRDETSRDGRESHKKSHKKTERARVSGDGTRAAAAPSSGRDASALASPVPKPTPTADLSLSDSRLDRLDRPDDGFERSDSPNARGVTSDASRLDLAETRPSSAPEASGEPSVEPTPISRTAAWPDADAEEAKAFVADATPVAESDATDIPQVPAASVTSATERANQPAPRMRRGGDGPPSPTDRGPAASAAPSAPEVSATSADPTLEPSTRSFATLSETTSLSEARVTESDASERTGEPSESNRRDAPTESSAADPASAGAGGTTVSSTVSDPEHRALRAPVAPSVRDAYAAGVNYAAASNGAKIVSANPESKATAVNALKENRDSYYLSPCATSGTDPASGRPRNKWITVELSETVSVTAVTIANYEFHASAPRAFEVWGTAGPADAEDGYFLIMRAVANEAREPQTFEVSLDGKGHALWSKHVRFAFASHYGAFHFCTLSLLRVHGKDATQTLKEEMEAIDAEAREVEEILRENDEANEILREKERAEAERRGGGEEAEASIGSARRSAEQAAAARVLETVRVGDGGEGEADGIPGSPGFRDGARHDDARHRDARDARDGDGHARASVSGDVRPGPGGSSVGEVGAREPLDPAEARSPSGTEREGPSGYERVDAASAAKANDERTKADERAKADDAKAPDVHFLGSDKNPGSTTTTRDESAVDAPLDEPSRKNTETRASEREESAFGESASGVDKKDAPGPVKKEASASLRETESGSKPTDSGSKPVPLPASSSSENVFSIMAKKIKALELNQSMFDRYVEASIARVAERLDDVSADVEAAEETAANATAASLRAEAKALAAAKDASRLEEDSKTARIVIETRANALERRLAALERETFRETSRNRAALGATLLVVAVATTLFAAVALLDASASFASDSDLISMNDGATGDTPGDTAAHAYQSQSAFLESRKALRSARNKTAGVGVDGLDRAARVKEENGVADRSHSPRGFPDGDEGNDLRGFFARRGEGEFVRLPSIDSRSFLRSTRVFIESIGASKEEARTARLVAGIGALAIAALCAFCGCGLLLFPPAKVAFAFAARGLRRGVAWTHGVFSLARKIDPVGLARASFGFVKALVERFERWRLGGGGG
jgi:hypothetical protein